MGVEREVTDVLVRHAGQDFVGLVAHGSAVKGGLVAGSSDLDLRLYLTVETLPWERLAALHRDLGRVDPAPYAYVQCETVRADAAEPLVPGTWRLLAGTCPAPVATADEVVAAAPATIERSRRALVRTPAALLEHGSGRLEREVRLLATDVWPAVYAAAVLHADDPLAVWAMPKDDVVATLPEPLRATAATYADRLREYHARGTTLDDALMALEAGVAVIRAIDKVGA